MNMILPWSRRDPTQPHNTTFFPTDFSSSSPQVWVLSIAFSLPLQQQLLEAVYKVNPNIVLLLSNGRPLTIPWAAEHIPAILETWQLGTQSGNAIAQVLFGEYNPSGKLPMSFPRNVGQLPIYYNYKNTGRPSNNEPESVFWSHYIDQKNQSIAPFP